MKIFFTIGIILMLFQCTYVKKRNHEEKIVRDETRELLMQFIENYYTTMSERDWDVYRSFFYDSATITTIWQTPGDSIDRVHITTIDEFIRKAPEGPDSQPIFEERMTSFRTEIEDNLAVVWADYKASFGTPDSLATWTGTDLFSLMRHNDSWKIVSLSFQAGHE